MMWSSLKSYITGCFRGSRPTRIILYIQGQWCALTVDLNDIKDEAIRTQVQDAISVINARSVVRGIEDLSK